MTLGEFVQSHFSDARPSGNGFKCRCPAHADRNPSLSIYQRPGDRVRLKCFAGCAEEEIIRALGVRKQNLFTDHQQTSVAGRAHQPSRVFATAEEAAKAHGLGEPHRGWAYCDATGKEVGRTLRWDRPGGKEIRPLSVRPDGWSLCAPPAPRHLFNLPALIASETAVAYVVEGEKKVDALTSLGFLATTSMGGASAPHKSDWSVLADRSVVILPDNDEPGRKYAEAVTRLLHLAGATVRIVELPGLPEGGDVADLFDQCASDQERKALRERIENLTSAAEEVTMSSHAAPSPLTFEPFPSGALPETVRAIVIEAARSIGCDEAAIAPACLTGLGVAIGNWRLKIKGDWTAPPVIWTVLAAESGQRKSPALDITLDFFRARQAEQDRKFLERPRSKDRNDGVRPFRIWTDNGTIEGLGKDIATNPKGILFGCDELATWLGALGKYGKGKGVTDEVGWFCARYGGRGSSSSRADADRTVLCVDGLLGITGATTPGTLRELLGPSIRESGLLARLLICIPPKQPRLLSDDSISATTKKAYHELLDALLAEGEPKTAALSSGAWNEFQSFVVAHGEETDSTEDRHLQAALSKLEELPARLALILHVAEGGGGEVTTETMRRAIAITGWFKAQARRSYAILFDPDLRESLAKTEAERITEKKVLAFLVGRGAVTVSELQAGCHDLRGSADGARALIERLVASGKVVAVEHPSGSKGGRPTTKYELASHPLSAQPPQTREISGCADTDATENEDADWREVG
jgi:hypothetical protein